jgi:hypothetical protein
MGKKAKLSNRKERTAEYEKKNILRNEITIITLMMLDATTPSHLDEQQLVYRNTTDRVIDKLPNKCDFMLFEFHAHTSLEPFVNGTTEKF